jgi:cellulose synthase (UDP-forming)
MKALDQKAFLQGQASKKLLVINASLATAYFCAITFGFRPGNPILFGMLIFGEISHLFQLLGYVSTVWDQHHSATFDDAFNAPVDVFITVAGEPVEIVEETARAAMAMEYAGSVHIYLLNDGFVAKKENWRDIEALAARLGIGCITRKKPGGAKAGNINSGLRSSKSPYFVVFDADHVPHTDFLQETMGFFDDERMGFVQSPQFYKNQRENAITQIAWDQQALFFGPIMTGKNRLNSAFMCGTNMVLRREAILQAGGMCEFNIAEDFLTSLFIHNKGWNSLYVPKVLAEGLAPEDFLSYYKQQFRWTRGSLEVIFKYNPLFMRGLSWSQRFQYLISASYYLSGVIVLVDAMLPIIFLLTGAVAVVTSTMALAFVFLPYIFIALYTLQITSNFTFTYEAIAFSLSSFYIQIKAIFAILTNEKTSFAVTSKKQIQGNFLYLSIPQLVYCGLLLVALAVGFVREGVSASLLANLAWGLVNVAAFLPFILASGPQGKRKMRSLFSRKKTTVLAGEKA